MIPTTILFYQIQPPQPPVVEKPPPVIEKPPPVIKAKDHNYVAVPEFDSLIRTVRMYASNREFWKYYKCKQCPYKSKSYFIIRSHIKRHRVTKTSKVFNCQVTASERYKCTGCSYKTPLLVNFNKHIEISHRNLEIKVEEGTEQPLVFDNINWMSLLKTYNCEHCSFKTASQLVYVRHYLKCPTYKIPRNKEKNKEYEIEFVKKYDLEGKTTLEKQSRKNIPFRKQNGWFGCPHCPYESKTRTEMSRHLIKHASPEDKLWYYCELCPFRSIWSGSVTNHLKNIHMKSKGQRKKTQSQPYECSKCEFKSRTRKRYLSHLASRHGTDKDLDWIHCTHCSYKTLSTQYLHLHKRNCHYSRHIGADTSQSPSPVTWFTCDQNDFKTKDHNALKEHILEKHASQEVVTCYKCNLCSYRTFELEELTTHIVEKHVDPQFTDWIYCEMCPDKFKKNTDLKKHVLDDHIL